MLSYLSKSIFILLFMPSLAFCAIPSDATWEVRTTGDSTNGGFYDTGGTGTDYSQQDSAQLTLTDCTTSGAGSTTLTSSTGGFTSLMVDNGVYIASGTNFDVGYYEIVTFTDSNNVVLDRTPSSGGAGSGGNIKVGGAVDEPGTIDDSSEVSAGHTVYIKSGTYTEAWVVNINASSTTRVQWIGYQTTRGDNPTGSNRPKFDANGGANANCMTMNSSTDSNYFYNLWFDGATGDCVTDSGNNFFQNCRFSNCGDDGVDDVGANARRRTYAFCEFDNNTDFGAELTGQTSNGPAVFGCYAHDNGDDGFAGGGGSSGEYFHTISESNSSMGFNSVYRAINCIAYNNSGAGTDGFASVDYLAIVFNNVSTDNGDDGFDGDSNEQPFGFDYNAYQGNAGNGIEDITAGANDVTADPSFTDEAGGDFTVGSSSPLIDAGALAGESANIGLTGTYKTNIGIDQDDVAAGGGGGEASFTFSGG